MITQEAKRLRDFRESLKMNQSEFAEVLNTRQDTLSRYESGKLGIPFDIIRILHRKFKMNYQWFFDGVGPMKTTEVTRPSLITDLSALQVDFEIMKKAYNSQNLKIKALERELDALKFVISNEKLKV